jgi:hypothetical protein
MTSSETASVRAPEVSSYLTSKGWEREGDWRGASVWRLGTEARLLVPDLREYEDADQLIREAVAKIAKYEARPERDVWQDIAEPMVDAQFFRLHPDAPSGSIPLPAGVKAAQGILDILKSAATVAERGAPLLAEGRRSRRVDSFLHDVLLGSALPGSYVLTARAPTAPVEPQQLEIFDVSREFSGRAVIKHLRTALEAARAAADRVLTEHAELDTFYAAAEGGVSPSMCRALSDLGGERRDLPFEIGFSWARGLPGQEPTPEIKFTKAMPKILASAADELEALGREGTASIAGVITDLHDEESGPSRVKIKGELQAPGRAGFPQRSIWVVLSAADYNSAIEAHRRRQYVEAIGRLATTGRLELHADSFRVPH